MTKKEFVWLVIRAIGMLYLLRIIVAVLMFIVALVTWQMIVPQGNYTLSLITQLVYMIKPLLLTLYFLFFGTFIYNLISRCVRSRSEDVSLPAGYCYCEIIIRFIGLWFIGVIISRLCLSLWLPLQSAIMVYFTRPEHFQQMGLAAFFPSHCGITTILGLALYLFFGALAVWYFFKHGKVFINLLNRLWLKASGNSLNQNPVNPV